MFVSALSGSSDSLIRVVKVNVDTLLLRYKAEISELRGRLGSELPNSQDYDEIFLLRFVLTWEKKGGLTEAVRAVRATIQWRTQNAQKLAETRRTGIAPYL